MWSRKHVLTLTLAILLPGCATVGRSVRGIDNFDVVESGVVYRGAQPSHQGIETLKSLGVRTIVNLRHDPRAWEERECIAAGIDYIWIPMFASDVKPAQVENVLRAFGTAERPIFVHCRFGRDRTGLAVGAWRLTDGDWPREKIIEELHVHGYNWLAYPGIERYLRSVKRAELAGD